MVKSEISEFFKKEDILIEKKTKKGIREIDIRPMIFDYEVNEGNEKLILSLKVASGSNSSLNPSLVIKAMERYIDGFVCE